MSDKVESFTHEGKTVTLFYDQGCANPREDSGHFLWLGLPHRRYNIGDEQLPTSFRCHTCDGTGLADPDREPVTGEGDDCPDCDGHGYSEPDADHFDLVAWLTVEHEARLVEPVSLYDRSGTSYTLGVSRGWDCGVCGFMVATDAQLTEWGYDPATVTDDTIRESMKVELDVYTRWANGDCYGYVITEPNVCPNCDHDDPVELDSCWGFIGRESAIAEAKAFID